MTKPLRSLGVIVMCFGMALTGCHGTKPYERQIEPSYDATGQPRPGYVTLNRAYMEALYADLVACYGEKRP